MKQIELTSKFGLALIAITAISVVMATHAYYIQAADAQARIPNNSVRSETIVDGQVKTQDIANGAVTSEKLADGAGGGDIELVQHRVQGDLVTVSSGGSHTARVDCPAGEILSGGGFSGGYFGLHVITSIPLDEDTWLVAFHNEGPDEGSLAAVGLCIDPSIP